MNIRHEIINETKHIQSALCSLQWAREHQITRGLDSLAEHTRFLMNSLNIRLKELQEDLLNTGN
jgi:hypothetical protein